MVRALTTRSLLLSLLAILSSAPTLLAQAADASIPVAGSEAFLGAWTVSADGDTGPVTLKLALTDNGGRLAARITGGEAESRVVQSVSKSADGALAVAYTLTMQGQAIPTVLTLKSEGGSMKATIDLAGGMIVLRGDAKKDP